MWRSRLTLKWTSKGPFVEVTELSGSISGERFLKVLDAELERLLDPWRSN